MSARLNIGSTSALLALLAAATVGCSSGSPVGGTGGAGGGAGAGSSGAGGSGSGTGGNPGSGGSGGRADGGSGGATGSGGSPGSGGGAGGAGGTPGSGGSTDAGGDLATDRASDGPGGGGPTLDACFAGLRAAVGSFQIGNKASADGKFRVRLALEDRGRIGTSGSKAWSAFRFAIETPDGNVCVNEELALAQAYKGTLHNCMDTFDLTVAGRRYLIAYPDTDPSRPKSSLKIFMGATMTVGPVDLDNGTCMTAAGQCRSGGPC